MQRDLDNLLSKGPLMVLNNINKVQNKISRILDDTLNMDIRGCTGARVPAADFYDKGDKYVIDIDVPGADPEKVEITSHVGKLRVSYDRVNPNKPKVVEEGDEGEEEAFEDNYLLQDIKYGKFERTFDIPSEVDESKVKAAYKEGVLSITVPKIKEAKAKKIKIETEHRKNG